MTQRRWPARLWLVRHGESAGNLARDAANAAGQVVIDIAGRDVDVPLSPLGQRQATALGRWFTTLDEANRPTASFASPYVRAEQTLEAIRAAGGLVPNAVSAVDERLREKEFGLLDRLTRFGVEQRYPEQAEIRTRVGKFYYRPPAGESWTDVILRLRTFADTMSLHHSDADSRVLIVAHQVIVLCMRYLIEGLSEREILTIDAAGDVANCGVTEYEFAEDRLRLVRYNFTAPLESQGAPVTTEPDIAKAPR
jgi:probable phosphoglycerate mutase